MAPKGRPGARALLARARAEGTPLIDRVRGHPHERRITLVFQGGRSLRNVVVVGSLTSWDVGQGTMVRVGRSNLWSLSKEVPDDLRTTYLFSPNDSLVPFDQERRWDRRSASFQPDAWNPREFFVPKDPEIRGDQDYRNSIVELPRAPTDPLALDRPSVPRGRVTLHRRRSRWLRNERRVWTYEPPPGGTSRKPPNLLITLDGTAHTALIPVPTILDNLQARGQLGPTWMVSVDSLTQADRVRELSCHPPFVRFLAEELVPWMHDRMPRRPSAGHTFVAGQSMGGLTAIYAVLSRSDVFGGALSQSATLGWAPANAEPEWLARAWSSAKVPRRRFHLEVGTLENTVNRNTNTSLVTSNRHLRDVLVAGGHTVCYHEFHGGHDYVCWRESFSHGLRTLFAGG